MKYTIKAPRQLNASINLPASKSISNRALVINAMAGCKLQPHNLSDCDDTEVIIAALRDMLLYHRNRSGCGAATCIPPWH